MSHRRERLAHFVRDVVSDAIANRINDPRVHRFTSVTRVEISPDLRVADVHFSVMGTDSDGRTTMRGLASARGMIQTRLARQVNMRQCPALRFHLDEGIKKAIDTIEALNSISGADAEDSGDRRVEVKTPGNTDHDEKKDEECRE